MNEGPEVFREIPGTGGYYRASNLGRIQSCKTNHPGFLRPWKDLSQRPNHQTGHMTVLLTIDGKHRCRLVHRLVLEAFVGPCPEGMEACHDPDPSPTNNRLGNLRWDTHISNMEDQKKHGTMPMGEAKTGSKLSKDQVMKIRDLAAAGHGPRGLGREFGVSHCTIRAIISRRSWAHV